MSLEVKYRGNVFAGKTVDQLRASIIKFLTRKDQEINEEEIEILLSRNVKTVGKDKLIDDGSKLNKVHKGRITFKEAVNGANALLSNFMGDTASDKEVKRRSHLCYACKERTETTDCKSCGFGGKLAGWWNKAKLAFGGEVTDVPRSVKGDYCGICSCSLALMIPSKMTAFNESKDKQDARPTHCWVKRTSPNFHAED